MPDQPVVIIPKLRAWLLADPDPQYVIAANCGIHPSELSRFALGDPIPQHHLLALAEYFGVDTNELLGDYEVPIG